MQAGYIYKEPVFSLQIRTLFMQLFFL